ncbi:MAG: acyl-CoA thioesterase [Ancalomicrobiaceae bacterium]|nr:acyl-CoA thioesterase [Ancalomicrobiaceae bacterium]
MSDLQSQPSESQLPERVPLVRTIAMPADTNPAGDIFGGWLMAQMDLAAGNAAARRARGRCVTIAVEAITFLKPVFVGDEVSLYGEIVSTGRTSMKIAVEAWRRDRHSDETVKVTQATFTFVAIGADRRPRPLP